MQKFIRAYINDIIIFSHSFEKHLKYLIAIFFVFVRLRIVLKLFKIYFDYSFVILLKQYIIALKLIIVIKKLKTIFKLRFSIYFQKIRTLFKIDRIITKLRKTLRSKNRIINATKSEIIALVFQQQKQTTKNFQLTYRY